MARVFPCIVVMGLIGALAACNDDMQEMRGAGSPEPDLPFYSGPVSPAFTNTLSPASFRSALAGFGTDVGAAAGALALTAHKGVQFAPTAVSQDDLVELAACDGLRTSLGGLLLRSQVGAPPLDPGTLVGQPCDAAVANAGLSFAAVIQTLQAQTLSLAEADVPADACTSAQAAPAPLAGEASVALELLPVAGGQSPLGAGRWTRFQAFSQGGGDGTQLALHAEAVGAGVAGMGPGGRRSIYHRIGMGTLIDPVAHTSTSGKSEELLLRDFQGGTILRDSTLSRNVTVTMTHGPTPEIDESSDYLLFDRYTRVGHWTIAAHVKQGGAAGLTMDVTVVDDQTGTRNERLSLRTQSDGRCLAVRR